ncbi:hypothetical protein [Stenotrophomonas maltophilia]|uniref:hypothetical protein n=1 Tax=Stenotrophomonas maltophilia TaxID=40324 RepID=UPI003D1885BC
MRGEGGGRIYAWRRSTEAMMKPGSHASSVFSMLCAVSHRIAPCIAPNGSSAPMAHARRKMLMADTNRLHRMLWVPFALMGLAACSPANDPAQTVKRDAGTKSAPARPVGDAMQMQPARPAEREVLPDAMDVQRNADGSVDVRKAMPESVALRRTDDGGVEIRKVDPAAGQAADTAPAEAKPQD